MLQEIERNHEGVMPPKNLEIGNIATFEIMGESREVLDKLMERVEGPLQECFQLGRGASGKIIGVTKIQNACLTGSMELGLLMACGEMEGIEVVLKTKGDVKFVLAHGCTIE